MFWAEQIITGTGPLHQAWLAFARHQALTKSQVERSDIAEGANALLELLPGGRGAGASQGVPLRMAAPLVLGLTTIYERKVGYLYKDAIKVEHSLQAMGRPGGSAGKPQEHLARGRATAAPGDITLPPVGGSSAAAAILADPDAALAAARDLTAFDLELISGGAGRLGGSGLGGSSGLGIRSGAAGPSSGGRGVGGSLGPFGGSGGRTPGASLAGALSGATGSGGPPLLHHHRPHRGSATGPLSAPTPFSPYILEPPGTDTFDQELLLLPDAGGWMHEAAGGAVGALGGIEAAAGSRADRQRLTAAGGGVDAAAAAGEGLESPDVVMGEGEEEEGLFGLEAPSWGAPPRPPTQRVSLPATQRVGSPSSGGATADIGPAAAAGVSSEGTAAAAAAAAAALGGSFDFVGMPPTQRVVPMEIDQEEQEQAMIFEEEGDRYWDLPLAEGEGFDHPLPPPPLAPPAAAEALRAAAEGAADALLVSPSAQQRRLPALPLRPLAAAAEAAEAEAAAAAGGEPSAEGAAAAEAPGARRRLELGDLMARLATGGLIESAAREEEEAAAAAAAAEEEEALVHGVAPDQLPTGAARGRAGPAAGRQAARGSAPAAVGEVVSRPSPPRRRSRRSRSAVVVDATLHGGSDTTIPTIQIRALLANRAPLLATSGPRAAALTGVVRARSSPAGDTAAAAAAAAAAAVASPEPSAFMPPPLAECERIETPTGWPPHAATLAVAVGAGAGAAGATALRSGEEPWWGGALLDRVWVAAPAAGFYDGEEHPQARYRRRRRGGGGSGGASIPLLLPAWLPPEARRALLAPRRRQRERGESRGGGAGEEEEAATGPRLQGAVQTAAVQTGAVQTAAVRMAAAAAPGGPDEEAGEEQLEQPDADGMDLGAEEDAAAAAEEEHGQLENGFGGGGAERKGGAAGKGAAAAAAAAPPAGPGEWEELAETFGLETPGSLLQRGPSSSGGPPAPRGESAAAAAAAEAATWAALLDPRSAEGAVLTLQLQEQVIRAQQAAAADSSGAGGEEDRAPGVSLAALIASAAAAGSSGRRLAAARAFVAAMTASGQGLVQLRQGEAYGPLYLSVVE